MMSKESVEWRVKGLYIYERRYDIHAYKVGRSRLGYLPASVGVLTVTFLGFLLIATTGCLVGGCLFPGFSS